MQPDLASFSLGVPALSVLLQGERRHLLMSCNLAFYSRIKARIVQRAGKDGSKKLAVKRHLTVYLIIGSLAQIGGNLGRTVSNHSDELHLK